MYTLRNEGVGTVRETRELEVSRGNNANIRSLIDGQGREVLQPERMCETFQKHFAQLFGTTGGSERRVFFSGYQHNKSQLSLREAKKSCERPI